MFKWLLPLLLLPSLSLAQNPTCPTRPNGDNTNACASTAFVQAAVTASGAISALTGDVTASGPGSAVATISALAVTSAKMAVGAAATNVGALGGDVTGTLPNPTIASAAVTGAKIASNTVTNSNLSAAGANTIKGNFTNSTGNEADNSVPSCSTNNSGLTYTSGSGLGCDSNLANLTVADQVVTGGANVTTQTLSTGNVTIDCGSRPLQQITNGGAFTITAPASDGSCIVKSTNNASAGAITFSGFSVGSNTGDSLDITNGHVFSLFIWRVGGTSGYRVAAHQ